MSGNKGNYAHEMIRKRFLKIMDLQLVCTDKITKAITSVNEF